MAELKTQKTEASVKDFIAAIEDPQQRKDSKTLAWLMAEATGQKPEMWGTSIVGFGTYNYKYASGHSGSASRVGFAPRSGKLSLYLMCQSKEYDATLEVLGKYKTGKGCLYISKLEDVDEVTLRKLVKLAWNESLKQYPQ